MDEAEYIIEIGHQVGSHLLSLMRNIKWYDVIKHAQLKNMDIVSNLEVKQKQQEVLVIKKWKNEASIVWSQLRKREKMNIKLEKRNSSTAKDQV